MENNCHNPDSVHAFPYIENCGLHLLTANTLKD